MSAGMIRRIESPSGARMIVDGREILNFGGSCYLGLSAEPTLLAAGEQALRGQGSTAQIPRHYGFAAAANLDVEDAARQYFGTGGAIYFAAGYLFGLIALTGLADEYDVVFLDASGHYNLRDGALAAGKPVHTFGHVDAKDLARLLAQELRRGERPLVATDGMFATFGTIAPLADYANLLEPLEGWLLVDESHSFGVLGPTGRGAVEHHAVGSERLLAGGSLGKAFCSYGGLAVGSAAAVAKLWKSPPARGAASGMSCGAAMAAASLRHLRAHPDQLARLRANVRRLKHGLRALGFEANDTEAPVAAFAFGNAAEMQTLQQQLFGEGIFVIYSTYVGAGPHGAIRCAAFADHEPADIDRLLDALDRHCLHRTA